MKHRTFEQMIIKLEDATANYWTKMNVRKAKVMTIGDTISYQ